MSGTAEALVLAPVGLARSSRSSLGGALLDLIESKRMARHEPLLAAKTVEELDRAIEKARSRSIFLQPEFGFALAALALYPGLIRQILRRASEMYEAFQWRLNKSGLPEEAIPAIDYSIYTITRLASNMASIKTLGRRRNESRFSDDLRALSRTTAQMHALIGAVSLAVDRPQLVASGATFVELAQRTAKAADEYLMTRHAMLSEA
jgi:hypothetical protein